MSTSFLQMGGHGFYVWTAYAIGVFVLLCNALWPFWAKKRFLRDYFRNQARRLRRGQAAE